MARVLLLLLALACSPSVVGEHVRLYLYHLQPPFVLGDGTERRGLVFELGELLNRHAPPDLRFEVALRPRQRLNIELAPWIDSRCPGDPEGCDASWMVFWVTPAWGWGAEAERRFLWVDLFQDQDLIVSRHPLDYRGPESLRGLSFAAMRGHFYPRGLEELMRRGEVQRLDGDSWRSALLRVDKGRADVTLIQRSSFDYYLDHDEEVQRIGRQLHVATRPFDSFTLQAMLPSERADLQNFLLWLKADPAWRRTFARYGLEAL
jgi:polar amino acid transport system substrate-binding protein